MNEPDYVSAQTAFANGDVISASRETLQKHLLAIAQNATGDDAIQSRDSVQTVTLNHLILQRHIDHLEAKNKCLQNLVFILTIASLIGTLAQVWFAYKAEIRADKEVPVSQPAIDKPSTALAEKSQLTASNAAQKNTQSLPAKNNNKQ